MPLQAPDLDFLPIPQGAMAWWLGAIGNVPTGWEVANGAAAVNDPTFMRANFPSRYVRNRSTIAPGAQAGSYQHAHTIPAHTHPLGSSTVGNYSGDSGGTGATINNSHAHGGATANAGPLGIAAVDHQPPYRNALPIIYTMRGRGAGGGVVRLHQLEADALWPIYMLVHWMQVTAIPTGFTFCDGRTVNGITTFNPDFRFFKHTPGYGNPGTIGGGPNHLHAADHAHGGTTGPNRSTDGGGAVSAWAAANTHGHASTAMAGVNLDVVSHEPSYIEGNIAMFTGHSNNGAGAASAVPAATGHIRRHDLADNLQIPRGIVLPWLQTFHPTGWTWCDGGAWLNAAGAPAGYAGPRPNLLDRYIRASAAGGGDTGVASGAASHAHGGLTHGHGINTATSDILYTHYGGGVTGSHEHTLGFSSADATPAGTNHPYYTEVWYLVRD